MVEYLTLTGWKIKKTKAYDDRRAGLLIGQANGGYLKSDVDDYIVKAGLSRINGINPTIAAKSKEIADSRAEKERAQADWWRIKADKERGKYVLKSDVEHELAARATFLRKDIENFFRSRASEMVGIAQGDQSKIPDFISFCHEAVADWLDRYAKNGDFTV